MKLPVTPAQSPKVYILHENQEWITTLLTSLEKRGLEYENWFLNEGKIDLGSTPPLGVFYNRMSASAHTRGHRFGPEFTAPVLAWLESHSRKVINGRRALQLELSKAEQYLALQQNIQEESREFNLLSNLMKTKHEAAKNAVNNIR